MEYIHVTKDNIEEEHICCAITNSKADQRVLSKKTWMKSMFDQGLTFIKLNERGKVFIEYLPAEFAWAPIVAPDYLHINCFWVSGKFVKQGHGSRLLDFAIEDAKSLNKSGLVVLSSQKKMPFLSDPKYLKKKGFILADQAGYFELLYLPLKEGASLPRFTEKAKKLAINEAGIHIYYSNQCPHTEMYTHIIKEMAIEKKVPITLHKYESSKEAQEGVAPFTTYSFFDQGKFVTNEIFAPKKFEKYLESR